MLSSITTGANIAYGSSENSTVSRRPQLVIASGPYGDATIEQPAGN